LPPLRWTEDEALAVTLGLRAAQQIGLAKTLPTIESALAKVERVLPVALRERVQAVQETVVLDLPVASEAAVTNHIITLSTAAYRGQRVWMRYQSKSGQQSERELDCYGLLYHDSHWYAIGYCHLREATRIFRLDHILALESVEEHFVRPTNFDMLAYAIQSFASIPDPWLVEALLDTPMEQIRAAVPVTFATLEESPSGILLRAYDNNLDHAARFLVNLGCPFRILNPPELLEALRGLAGRIMSTVDAGFEKEDSNPIL